MFGKIVESLGWKDSPAGAVARKAFLKQYPTFKCERTEIQLKGESRFIVAVYYQEPVKPPDPPKPTQYKLYTVPGDLSTAEEIPRDPDTPMPIKDL